MSITCLSWCFIPQELFLIKSKLSQLSTLPAVTFKARRQHLLDQLPANAVVIIAAAPSYIRNGDVEHTYRQDSDFYYLTGFAEPDSVLLLRNFPVDEDLPIHSLVLCRQKDKACEIWDGVRLGVEAAAQTLAVEAAQPIDELSEVLNTWLDGADYIYYSQQQVATKEAVDKACEYLRNHQRQGKQVPRFQADITSIIHAMRLFKKEEELALMRKAASVSAEAHIKLMQHCARQPQTAPLYEYQLAAHFQHACSMAGSQRLAYGSIVAGGANACILHYVDNHQPLHDGALVLIDAGCEWDYYAADITRTFPVNGRFSEPQKAIYQLVLDALEAALAVIKDGVPVDKMQQAAVDVITRGLVDLGILQGDPEALIEEGAYREFYMHNIGHWLGMDVHDAGQYKLAGQWRNLEAGMVTTVEPGIYIAPNNDEVDPKWWGIGVRIEDDVVVTKDGHENLTRQVPVTIAEIEALMQVAKTEQ